MLESSRLWWHSTSWKAYWKKLALTIFGERRSKESKNGP